MISIRSISDATRVPQLNSSLCDGLFASTPSIKTKRWLASLPRILICVCEPCTPLRLTARPATSRRRSLTLVTALFFSWFLSITVIALADRLMVMGSNEALTRISSISTSICWAIKRLGASNGVNKK